MFFGSENLEIFFQLFLAAVLGAFLGVERELAMQRLDWLTKSTNWYKAGSGHLALRRTEIDGARTSYPRELYPRRAIDAAIRASREEKDARHG